MIVFKEYIPRFILLIDIPLLILIEEIYSTSKLLTD